MSIRSIFSLIVVPLLAAWVVACGGGSVSGSGGGGSSFNFTVKLDRSVNSALFQTLPEYRQRTVAALSDLLISKAEAAVEGTIVYILDQDGVTVVASGPVDSNGEAFFKVPANDPGEFYSVCLESTDPTTCVTLSIQVTDTNGVQVTVGEDDTGALFVMSEGQGTQVEPDSENIAAFQDPDKEHKTILCHKPNGPSPHTISVATESVQAHLAHGDTLGPCPETPAISSTEENDDDSPGNSGNKGDNGNKGGNKGGNSGKNT